MCGCRCQVQVPGAMSNDATCEADYLYFAAGVEIPNTDDPFDSWRYFI